MSPGDAQAGVPGQIEDNLTNPRTPASLLNQCDWAPAPAATDSADSWGEAGFGNWDPAWTIVHGPDRTGELRQITTGRPGGVAFFGVD